METSGEEKKSIYQSRWKSKGAWGTFIIGIVIIAAYFFNQETVSSIEVVAGALLLIADGFGAFNDPKRKNGY